MGDTTSLVPAEVLEPSPPLTDHDLERFGDAVAGFAADAGIDQSAAVVAIIAGSDSGLPETTTRWAIDGQRTAGWAMAKYCEYLTAQRAIEAQAEEWIANIRGWASVELARRRIPASLAFFETHLSWWGLAERESNPSVATLVLPTGRVATTAHKPKVVVADEDAVIAWAESSQLEDVADVVNVKKSVALTVLRKFATPVEVTDATSVVLAKCGCIVGWTPEDSAWSVTPRLGDGLTCPSCGDYALIGDIEVTASHYEAHDPNGNPVPGCTVEGAHVTVKINADA